MVRCLDLLRGTRSLTRRSLIPAGHGVNSVEGTVREKFGLDGKAHSVNTAWVFPFQNPSPSYFRDPFISSAKRVALSVVIWLSQLQCWSSLEISAVILSGLAMPTLRTRRKTHGDEKRTNTNSTRLMASGPGIEPGPHWWECSHHCANPAPHCSPL